MKSPFMRIILGMVVLSTLSCTGFAQTRPAVGAKLPLLTLPEFFAAYDINELSFEFGIPLSAIALGFAIDANVKLFPWRSSPVRFAELGLPLRVFVGVGGSISLISGALSTGVHVLIGFDYLLPKSHVDFFMEAGIAFSTSPTGFEPGQGLLLGARYSF